MNLLKRVSSLIGAGALVTVAAGCSMDAVIWGSDGADVIEATEQLIHAAASGEADALTCDDGKADFGEPQDWEYLSAGEPERFHSEFWPEQALLDPSWNINLELGAEGVVSGQVFPGDVFYRETDDALCIVDIGWSTLEN